MNRLKELRKEKGLSQKELAKDVGVHYRTVQNWENGKAEFKYDKAKQLADFFGVSVGYLLGYESKLETIKSFKRGDLIKIEGQLCRIYKVGDGFAVLKEEAEE